MKLRIAEIIEEKGLKKSEVAQKAKILLSNFNLLIKEDVEEIEDKVGEKSKKINPTLTTLNKIAKALNVEVYELLTDELPAERSGLATIGGQTYALVKMPHPDVSSTIESFVESAINGREIKSLVGSIQDITYSVVFDPDCETGERFVVSVASNGGKTATAVYNQMEYPLVEDGEDCPDMKWDVELITKEIISTIESRGKKIKMYNSAIMC